MPADQKLPRTSRIPKRSEILRLQNSGQKAFSRHFLLILNPTEHRSSRIAVTITKKVDKRAVARNRLKRRVKEIFRLNRYRLLRNFDILVIARKNACQISYSEITREIMGALHHNGFLKSK